MQTFALPKQVSNQIYHCIQNSPLQEGGGRRRGRWEVSDTSMINRSSGMQSRRTLASLNTNSGPVCIVYSGVQKPTKFRWNKLSQYPYIMPSNGSPSVTQACYFRRVERQKNATFDTFVLCYTNKRQMCPGAHRCTCLVWQDLLVCNERYGHRLLVAKQRHPHLGACLERREAKATSPVSLSFERNQGSKTLSSLIMLQPILLPSLNRSLTGPLSFVL